MDWKLRGRLAGLLLLAFSFIAANAGYSIGPAQAGAERSVIGHGLNDLKTRVARHKAQTHFDQFLAFIWDGESSGEIETGVKLAVSDGNGAQEFVWVRPIAVRDGQYVGQIAEPPAATGGHKTGDAVSFDISQVYDWYFFGAAGKMYGAFATREELADLPEMTAVQIGAILSDRPLPAHW